MSVYGEPIFHKQTENSEEYQCILTDYIEFLNNTREEQKGWFQQDKGEAHISDSSMTFIQEFLAERVTSVVYGLQSSGHFFMGHLEEWQKEPAYNFDEIKNR